VDRRKALETTLKALALASVVSQRRAVAQETAASGRPADGTCPASSRSWALRSVQPTDAVPTMTANRKEAAKP
jgi:hypothetical protein